ncbi:hypothetical protein V8E52_002536, partial [Russula decolorans]
ATERFRILVIGNANAGKTTILDKVCHARGRKPDCFDTNGNKTASELKPSASRGEHDIEDNFQYPTAHGFVFHDSRGFEAGGANELDNVKEFINRRAKRDLLKDQLHAIWYCLPTSNDRAMTAAEMSLFESGTGNVPVIAIFTKMDALDKRAFNQLLNKGVSAKEARSKAPSLAKDKFERSYLRPLEDVKNKPAYIVQLRDMHKEGANCDEVILRTSRALNGDTLRLFCLSILRNDIESHIIHVMNRCLYLRSVITLPLEAHESGSFSDEQAKSLFGNVMCYFPYMLDVRFYVSPTIVTF